MEISFILCIGHIYFSNITFGSLQGTHGEAFIFNFFAHTLRCHEKVRDNQWVDSKMVKPFDNHVFQDGGKRQGAVFR